MSFDRYKSSSVSSWFCSQALSFLVLSVFAVYFCGCRKSHENSVTTPVQSIGSISISTQERELTDDAWVNLSAQDSQRLLTILDDAHDRRTKQNVEDASDPKYKLELEKTFRRSLIAPHIVPANLIKLQKSGKAAHVIIFDSRWRSASFAYSFSDEQVIWLNSIYKKYGLR